MGRKTPAQRRRTVQPRLKATRKTANRHARKVSIDNPAIKDKWDVHATVKDNYERLGLAADPNAAVDKQTASDAAPTPLVKELQQIAAHEVKLERHLSDGENKFLEALINKHGDDVEAMAYDTKLNPFMKTVGELRRKLAKYHKNASKAAAT